MSCAHTKAIALPIIVIALCFTGCSSTEEQKQQVAGGQPVDSDGLPILTDKQKEDGIICKSEPVTGTRISKKSCTTREQREANQRAAQEDLQRTKNRASGPTIFQ